MSQRTEKTNFVYLLLQLWDYCVLTACTDTYRMGVVLHQFSPNFSLEKALLINNIQQKCKSIILY